MIPKPTVKVRMKENGRDSRTPCGVVVPYALILVLKEESHESDVARAPQTKRSTQTPSTAHLLPRIRALRNRSGSPSCSPPGIATWWRNAASPSLRKIEARNIARAQVDLFEVPGSFEIPLHAQLLAKTRRYTAIVAAGLVVDGGIYRHEFVADTVIKALMDVQLRTEVPVFSAVLTPQQFHESAAHLDFFRKHFAIKGIEVAEACANTLLSLERLRGQVAAGIA